MPSHFHRTSAPWDGLSSHVLQVRQQVQRSKVTCSQQCSVRGDFTQASVHLPHGLSSGHSTDGLLLLRSDLLDHCDQYGLVLLNLFLENWEACYSIYRTSGTRHNLLQRWPSSFCFVSWPNNSATFWALLKPPGLRLECLPTWELLQ